MASGWSPYFLQASSGCLLSQQQQGSENHNQVTYEEPIKPLTGAPQSNLDNENEAVYPDRGAFESAYTGYSANATPEWMKYHEYGFQGSYLIEGEQQKSFPVSHEKVADGGTHKRRVDFWPHPASAAYPYMTDVSTESGSRTGEQHKQQAILQNHLLFNLQPPPGLHCGPAGKHALKQFFERSYLLSRLPKDSSHSSGVIPFSDQYSNSIERQGNEAYGFRRGSARYGQQHMSFASPAFVACRRWQQTQGFSDPRGASLVSLLRNLGVERNKTYQQLYYSFIAPRLLQRVSKLRLELAKLQRAIGHQVYIEKVQRMLENIRMSERMYQGHIRGELSGMDADVSNGSVQIKQEKEKLQEHCRKARRLHRSKRPIQLFQKAENLNASVSNFNESTIACAINEPSKNMGEEKRNFRTVHADILFASEGSQPVYGIAQTNHGTNGALGIFDGDSNIDADKDVIAAAKIVHMLQRGAEAIIPMLQVRTMHHILSALLEAYFPLPVLPQVARELVLQPAAASEFLKVAALPIKQQVWLLQPWRFFDEVSARLTACVCLLRFDLLYRVIDLAVTRNSCSGVWAASSGVNGSFGGTTTDTDNLSDQSAFLSGSQSSVFCFNCKGLSKSSSGGLNVAGGSYGISDTCSDAANSNQGRRLSPAAAALHAIDGLVEIVGSSSTLLILLFAIIRLKFIHSVLPSKYYALYIKKSSQNEDLHKINLMADSNGVHFGASYSASGGSTGISGWGGLGSHFIPVKRISSCQVNYSETESISSHELSAGKGQQQAEISPSCTGPWISSPAITKRGQTTNSGDAECTHLSGSESAKGFSEEDGVKDNREVGNSFGDGVWGLIRLVLSLRLKRRGDLDNEEIHKVDAASALAPLIADVCRRETDRSAAFNRLEEAAAPVRNQREVARAKSSSELLDLALICFCPPYLLALGTRILQYQGILPGLQDLQKRALSSSYMKRGSPEWCARSLALFGLSAPFIASLKFVLESEPRLRLSSVSSLENLGDSFNDVFRSPSAYGGLTSAASGNAKFSDSNSSSSIPPFVPPASIINKPKKSRSFQTVPHFHVQAYADTSSFLGLTKDTDDFNERGCVASSGRGISLNLHQSADKSANAGIKEGNIRQKRFYGPSSAACPTSMRAAISKTSGEISVSSHQSQGSKRNKSHIDFCFSRILVLMSEGSTVLYHSHRTQPNLFLAVSRAFDDRDEFRLGKRSSGEKDFGSESERLSDGFCFETDHCAQSEKSFLNVEKHSLNPLEVVILSLCTAPNFVSAYLPVHLTAFERELQPKFEAFTYCAEQIQRQMHTAATSPVVHEGKQLQVQQHLLTNMAKQIVSMVRNERRRASPPEDSLKRVVLALRRCAAVLHAAAQHVSAVDAHCNTVSTDTCGSSTGTEEQLNSGALLENQRFLIGPEGRPNKHTSTGTVPGYIGGSSAFCVRLLTALTDSDDPAVCRVLLAAANVDLLLQRLLLLSWVQNIGPSFGRLLQPLVLSQEANLNLDFPSDELNHECSNIVGVVSAGETTGVSSESVLPNADPTGAECELRSFHYGTCTSYRAKEYMDVKRVACTLPGQACRNLSGGDDMEGRKDSHGNEKCSHQMLAESDSCSETNFAWTDDQMEYSSTSLRGDSVGFCFDGIYPAEDWLSDLSKELAATLFIESKLHGRSSRLRFLEEVVKRASAKTSQLFIAMLAIRTMALRKLLPQSMLKSYKSRLQRLVKNLPIPSTFPSAEEAQRALLVPLLSELDALIDQADASSTRK